MTQTLMMRGLVHIALLLVSSLGVSQTVTVIGVVLDPNGRPYQNGSGVVTLVPQNQQWLVNGTNPVNSPIPIATLDSFGKFSVSLTNTSLISPSSASPQWQFSFCSSVSVASPPICFTLTPMAITVSQDISTQIQAQAAVLPSSSGGGTPCLIANTVQYNVGGVFACEALLAYSAATHTLSAQNITLGGTLSVGAPNSVCGLATNCIGMAISTGSVAPMAGFASFRFLTDGIHCSINAAAEIACNSSGPTLCSITDASSLSACIAAAPSSGAYLQSAGGTQTWAVCPTFGSNPIHLVMPPGVLTVNVNCTIPANVVVEFKKGAILKSASSVTVTLSNPPLADDMQQIFDISNAGSWIIPATGEIYIPWYGTDCTETTDASTILNIMTGTQDRFTARTLIGPDNCHLVVESTWIIKNQESLTLRTNKIPGLNSAFSISGRTSGTVIAPINKDVGIPLSRAGWTASADSFNAETPQSDGFPAMPASKVLTSPPATTCTQSSCNIWITCYIAADCAVPGVADPLPHYIRIDMGSAQTIAQVAYMPRQDAALGRPLSYDIQTSTNAGCAGGTGFISQTTGTWDGSPLTKIANFTPVSARCFEVIGNTSISGIYMAAANVNASLAAPTPWNTTADSVESGHPASFLIDGIYDDPTTYDRYWSTAFSGSPGLPHYVIIDMQVAQTVAGLAYTPRQALATTGFILGYDVQTSTNSSCASNVGFSSQTTGTWNWDYTTKTATWAPVSARCVKLIANTSSGGNTAAGKSIQLYGATGVPQADAGPVILLSRSGYSLFKGLTVQSQANGVSSNFSGSIQTLNYSHGPLSGGYTSTHNTFEDLYLTSNLQGNIVNNYKGFYIHNDPNQELFTFNNLQVNCQNGYFSYGFMSDDPNADSSYLQNSIVNNCMRAVGMIAGLSYIHGGNYSTNGGISAFGPGGAVIYELGSGCVAEMSNTVESEGTGQILNSGKDSVGNVGCNNSTQNFHDNQLTTPDLDPAVYPINFTGGGGITLHNNNMNSTPSVVHNSQLVGTDQVALFGTIGRITDDGNNTMTAPNVLVKVPTGGKGFNIARLSVSTAADQGYSSYPTQLLPANGPANGARAFSSPWFDFAGNVFNSIPSTPLQEIFTIRAATAADGVHSTFSFTEKGVAGAVGGAHMYAFDAPLSGVQISPVTQPAMDALTILSTPGSTNYGYKIECLAGSGHCAASTEATTATGPATLGSPANSCILINWRPAGPGGNVGAGAWGYKLFRTTCSGGGVCSTNPTGVVYTATNRDIDSGGNYGFTDCGTAGDGTSPDGTNTTGQIVSTTPTGLPPLSVSSTTVVPNLNANLLQGLSILSTTDTPGAITVNAGTCTDRAVTLATLTTTAVIMEPTANYALEANISLSAGQAVAGTLHYRICNVQAAGNITLNAAATFNLRAIQ